MTAIAALPFVANPAMARDVKEGLTAWPQKTLPASLLYDEVGSALFEVITLLPEYGLTRADAALLAEAAPDIICNAGKPGLVVELGSGTGTKTRHILAAAAQHGPVQYLPIDISAAALSVLDLAGGNLPDVQVEPIQASYLDGIDTALLRRGTNQRAMILFLGSTIGNFDRPEADRFLADIRDRMNPGDTLLLGADLVKPRPQLLAAYDDAAGVTAAFNLNLLARINRELGGQFHTKQFAHEARFNERHSRVEMHLRSLIAQTVRIEALDLAVSFTAGETIWTESSHKFRPQDVEELGESAGWSLKRQWFEREWGFTEALFELR